jgi:hypothetical protein
MRKAKSEEFRIIVIVGLSSIWQRCFVRTFKVQVRKAVEKYQLRT